MLIPSEGMDFLMISVNKDNAADIVRNILRQSQAVKGNIQSKESGRTI